MPEVTRKPRRASHRAWQLRVHDELWSLYLVIGLAGLCYGLGSAFLALDGGPWLLWVLAALGGLLLAVCAGVLRSVRGRGADPQRSWTRPA